MIIDASMKKIFGVLLALAACSMSMQATPDTTRTDGAWRYMPKFNGTFRGFFQQSTVKSESRFTVANARLCAGGYVLPWLDYLVQVDFCAAGKIRLMDAYATVTPMQGLTVLLGQTRVPFSVEASRAPHLYYFTDVSLTADFGNLRSVGIKAGYKTKGVPLYFEGGIFNSADMVDHNVWNRALTYGVKANYTAGYGLRPEVAFMSRVPGGTGNGIRVNQWNASLSWTYGRFFAEGEYIYRHYTGDSHKPSHAYNFFVDYGIPVNWRMADKLSFQARLDGISDASNGIRQSDGTLATTIDGHRRITAGATASRTVGKLYCAFRLNYEQYFYGHTENTAIATENSMLVAGLIFHF